MSRSLKALTDFEDLVAAILVDAGHATFSLATIDHGLAQALREYSRASALPGARVMPNLVVGTFAPAAGARETNIYSQAFMRNYIDVAEVWYPYVDAASDPQPVGFRLIENSGQALLRFDDAAGDGTSLARVFARCQHAIKDLELEAGTTVAAGDEDKLALGAAAYAIGSRSADIAEDSSLTIWTVPNYRRLADEWLRDFRAYIAPARSARAIPFRRPG